MHRDTAHGTRCEQNASTLYHVQVTMRRVPGLSPHSFHLFINREVRWGTTDDFTTSFLHFPPVLHCSLGLGELQACPFPDVVFPPPFLSALSSSLYYSTLQDGFRQT